jgi:hypothetical protein
VFYASFVAQLFGLPFAFSLTTVGSQSLILCLIEVTEVFFNVDLLFSLVFNPQPNKGFVYFI